MRYKTLLIDPPTPFKTYSNKGKGRSAENHYPTLSWEALAALPMQNLMAEDCAVFLWVCWPTLEQSLALGRAWGMEYKTCAFLWAKTNRSVQSRLVQIEDNPNWFMGMGYWTRSNTEPCLLFTRGKPQRKARNVRQLLIAAIGRHSQKPDKVYGEIEALTCGPYAEVFARQRREGWDSFGNGIDGRDIRDVLAIRSIQGD